MEQFRAMGLVSAARIIWDSGVEAVRPRSLLGSYVYCTPDTLILCDETFDLKQVGRLVVVGGGKAGAEMAATFEAALTEPFLAKLSGWVNVPNDCVRPLQRITLHGGRPSGINKPCAEGAYGAEQILRMVGELGPQDLCVVLLSGGGSALLPAPPPQISLEDKLLITRLLEDGGADIQEMNTVRKHISRIKGGGLGRASRAGKTICLILSDVIDDPLDIIASGPTVPNSTTAADALAVIARRCGHGAAPLTVLAYLQRRASSGVQDSALPDTISNHIIGNNALALEAAARRASELGFRVISNGSSVRGIARDVGRALAEQVLELRQKRTAPTCILSGGEPTVELAARRGKGGRNQEVALAALSALWGADLRNLVVLSGGTDGEDGPTDAAGGWASRKVYERAVAQGLHPNEFLEHNNAYPFLAATGGLFVTGPTSTNVMDIRVALVHS
ncbi:MAG: DUF4147 domain-containing protein [Bdellovibrionales bacterium]|nr:DUF4147 domain-containing protein [Bdellovibrionales bacterium]